MRTGLSKLVYKSACLALTPRLYRGYPPALWYRRHPPLAPGLPVQSTRAVTGYLLRLIAGNNQSSLASPSTVPGWDNWLCCLARFSS